MVFSEIIARLLLFPELINTYDLYLRKIKFRDSLVNDIIQKLLDSWGMFGEIKVEYLKEEFKDRDDVDLFMQKVAKESENLTGDLAFNRWWIGKFLSELVVSEIKNEESNITKMRDLVVVASELKEVSEGKVNPVYVWNFASEVEKRLNSKEDDEKVLKTGISLLDEQVKMSSGTLNLFMAPFKRYKSILLTNIGAIALVQGLSVFHIHYEGQRKMWETRYDSCLSGVAKSRLYTGLTEKERERIEKAYKFIQSKKLNLYFMSGMPGGTGYIEIRSELERLRREGIEFDVIDVDYLNLMKASKRHSDDWKDQGQMAWDLVNLSKMGYIVVSAIQAKMGSVDREILRSNDMGRSVVIPQAVDNLIAINQNETEKEQGCIRLSPIAIRDGEITKREIPVEMSLWKMRMSRELDPLFDKILEEVL